MGTGSSEAKAILSGRFIDHLTDETGELAFSMSPPAGAQCLWVVTDRSGFVLGRMRSLAGAISVIESHVTAFLPVPTGCVRLAMRTIVSDDGRVALVEWPLFWAPPVIERRLVAIGWRVVDRLVTDIEVANCEVQPPEQQLNDAVTAGVGHCHAEGAYGRIVAVLGMGVASETPSQARLIHRWASASRGASASQGLDLAEGLSQIAMPLMTNDDSASIYGILKTL